MNTELSTEFPTRLLTLSDGRPGLRGALHVEITEPPAAHPLPSDGRGIKSEGSPPSDAPTLPRSDATAAVLDFVSSDETLDRYDEVIVASGWRLENYLRNPVFQNSHQYGDILFTLGKALITDIRTVAGRQVLFQRIEFAVDANPMARIAYGLYKSKFLSAVSVGFIPLRWQNADSPDRSADILSAVPQSSALPGVNPSLVLSFDPALGAEAAPVPAMVRSPVVSSPVVSGAPVYRRKYLEQELLEVSAVAIPANPSALALALRSGAVEKSDLRETLDLLRSVCGSPAPMTPIIPISPIGPMLADFLPLARDLRDLLRR
jgi:hypothetical protein